jgi:UDP-glucose 4-epimerase
MPVPLALPEQDYCLMQKKTFLVTGGAGFIGSMVNLMLHDAGHDTIVLDNLTSGDARAVVQGTLIQGDLSDHALLERLFQDFPIEGVLHFAALTDVGESVADPAKYYDNNVQATLTLLHAMQKNRVQHLIFSSSAAVYGIPEKGVVTESSPCHPINPYGETKLIVEKILRDYAKAYGFKSCSLRYFNAAGGDPSGRLKHFKKKENNLIPLVIKAIEKGNPLEIFGTDYPTPDGTCIRDYIHVADLGKAHLLALEKLFADKASPCYNLGNGKGFSVREVVKASEKVTGHALRTVNSPRRTGDPPLLLAESQKAQCELGWKSRYPELETIISDAWKARH